MPTKIYSPKDFPKPAPDQYREELLKKVADKIESQAYERTDNGIKITLENFSKYTKDNFIDFQTYYALHGGWKSVTVVRAGSNVYLTITMEW